MIQQLGKTVFQFLKRLNTEFPNDPAILLFSICLRKMKTILKKNLDTSVDSSIIHNGQKAETTLVSIN